MEEKYINNFFAKKIAVIKMTAIMTGLVGFEPT